MNNTNLDLIREFGLEDAMVFRDPDYDDAIVGIEFIDYNTIRTIPYLGVNAPIIMQNI